MSEPISVRIPDEAIWDQFKNFVKNKYHGKTHTVMGIELQQALIQYMSTEGNPSNMAVTPQENSTRTHKSENESNLMEISNKASKVDKISAFVKQGKTFERILISEDGQEESYIQMQELRDYIMLNYGADNRTIAKYARFFLARTLYSDRIPPRSNKEPSDMSDKEIIGYLAYYQRMIVARIRQGYKSKPLTEEQIALRQRFL